MSPSLHPPPPHKKKLLANECASCWFLGAASTLTRKNENLSFNLRLVKRQVRVKYNSEAFLRKYFFRNKSPSSNQNGPIDWHFSCFQCAKKLRNERANCRVDFGSSGTARVKISMYLILTPPSTAHTPALCFGRSVHSGTFKKFRCDKVCPILPWLSCFSALFFVSRLLGVLLAWLSWIFYAGLDR